MTAYGAMPGDGAHGGSVLRGRSTEPCTSRAPTSSARPARTARAARTGRRYSENAKSRARRLSGGGCGLELVRGGGVDTVTRARRGRAEQVELRATGGVARALEVVHAGRAVAVEVAVGERA